MYKSLALYLILISLLGTACSSSQEANVEIAFPNLRFNRPVDFQAPLDSSNRLFVVEQRGVIKVFENIDSVSQASDFLDIENKVRDSGNEEGLLGLAFHPDFRTNGYFFVNYTASNPRRTVVARYQVQESNPDFADPQTEKIIVEIEQPYPNHNGGQVAFGPDGYLYIATGDGGSAGDPIRNGQNTTTLLGNILRVDVDTPDDIEPYTIPPDNPFIGQTAFRPEIYAYGLRNPWRFSFDAVTGDLWTGDVGQNEYEEINLVEKGGNYGWNIREAANCFSSSPVPCTTEGLIDPVYEYGRNQGGSITGGFVYHGTQLPEYAGKYIYADYASGRIWALTWNGQSVIENRLIDNTNLNISSFGVDSNNELYICAFDGFIYSLKPQG